MVDCFVPWSVLSAPCSPVSDARELFESLNDGSPNNCSDGRESLGTPGDGMKNEFIQCEKNVGATRTLFEAENGLTRQE